MGLYSGSEGIIERTLLWSRRRCRYVQIQLLYDGGEKLIRFVFLGVCVAETACKSSGGISTAGGCHSDPVNVKCCTKASCSTSGNCRWNSDCTGDSVANQCPGPSAFKCCLYSVWPFHHAPYNPVICWGRLWGLLKSRTSLLILMLG